MDVGDSQELLLDRGVGRDDEVVLVLAPLALALGREDPTTRKGRFLMRMIWPTGSWSGKRVLATVAPRMQTLSEDEDVPGGEVRSVGQDPVADGDVLLVAALRPRCSSSGCRPRPGRGRGPRASTCRRWGAATTATASSMVRVVVVPEPPRTPPAPAVPAPGRDVDEGRPLALDLLVDGGPRAAAERDHGDDRGHADDHAEHGEDRAHLVAAHGLEGDAKGVPNAHAMPPLPRAGGPGAPPPRDAASPPAGPR